MITLLFLLTVFCSLLSQTPAFLDAGMDAPLKLTWILPFIALILRSPRSYISNQLVHFYLYTFCFTFFCFACQMMTGNKYFSADLYNISLCLVFTVTSYIYWKVYGSDKNLKLIVLIMMVGGILLSVNVYTNFLAGSNLLSASYAFGDKNSMGQILLCCSFFILVFYKSNNKIHFWVSRLIACFILLIMIIMRSRATLVSAFVMALYYFYGIKSRRLKLAVTVLIVLVVGGILASGGLKEIILQGIIMGGRNADNADALSSGRLTFFIIAFNKIPGHWLIGSGEYYVDNLPLNFLVQYGIVGLAMTLVFLFIVFRKIWKNRKINTLLNATMALYIGFLADGLFEAQTPFGPGIKCFSLWMFYGFSLAEIEKAKISNTTQINDSDFTVS